MPAFHPFIALYAQRLGRSKAEFDPGEDCRYSPQRQPTIPFRSSRFDVFVQNLSWKVNLDRPCPRRLFVGAPCNTSIHGSCRRRVLGRAMRHLTCKLFEFSVKIGIQRTKTKIIIQSSDFPGRQNFSSSSQTKQTPHCVMLGLPRFLSPLSTGLKASDVI